MLAEPYRELLSAYVDGELSAGQRRTVQRLLDRSPEAREYLRQIQANAENLRNLPRRQLDAEFPGRVLTAIRDRNLRPGRYRATSSVPVTLPGWVSVASAAERFRFPFRLRSSHMNSGQVEEQRMTAQITDDQNGQRTSTQPIASTASACIARICSRRFACMFPLIVLRPGNIRCGPVRFD